MADRILRGFLAERPNNLCPDKEVSMEIRWRMKSEALLFSIVLTTGAYLPPWQQRGASG